MPTRVANESLADAMDRQTVVGDPALWWAEGDRIRCVACGHRCLIGPGLRGICKVRINEDGKLKVPFGYVAARYDPQCLIQRSYGSLQVVRISHDFIPNTQNVTKVH